ncbi:MAG: TonB family protein, partial [Pseudanabaenaceae cyanobacterium]
PPAEPFAQRLAAAYGEYGFDRVLTRQIAPPEVPIPSEKRELGIDWIPPDPEAAAGKTGTVTVLLIVAPDGTVERELIDSEGDRDLVDLARTTATQYRFAPLTAPEEQDKYRFITVKYVFAPPVEL